MLAINIKSKVDMNMNNDYVLHVFISPQW